MSARGGVRRLRVPAADGALSAEGLFASTVVPEGIPPKAALARRTLWLVKRSSVVVLFAERPTDGQWGPGSRHVFRSALYHLKPVFVVPSRPPAAPAYCRVVASEPVCDGAGLLGGAAHLPRRVLRR